MLHRHPGPGSARTLRSPGRAWLALGLRLLAAAAFVATLATEAAAEPVAPVIPFRRTVSGVRVPGTHTFRFSLFQGAAGGSPVWSEEKTLRLRTSTLRTRLGDASPLGLAGLDFGVQLWVQVERRRSGGGYRVLGARKRLTASPYALASEASAWIDGGVSAAMLQAGSVTQPALAAGAVTGQKIAAGAVDTPHLADGAVTPAKLATGAVGIAQLDPGSVTGAKIQSLASQNFANSSLPLSLLSLTPARIAVSAGPLQEITTDSFARVCFLTEYEATEGPSQSTNHGCLLRIDSGHWQLTAVGGSVSTRCAAVCYSD